MQALIEENGQAANSFRLLRGPRAARSTMFVDGFFSISLHNVSPVWAGKETPLSPARVLSLLVIPRRRPGPVGVLSGLRLKLGGGASLGLVHATGWSPRGDDSVPKGTTATLLDLRLDGQLVVLDVRCYRSSCHVRGVRYQRAAMARPVGTLCAHRVRRRIGYGMT